MSADPVTNAFLMGLFALEQDPLTNASLTGVFAAVIVGALLYLKKRLNK